MREKQDGSRKAVWSFLLLIVLPPFLLLAALAIYAGVSR